MLDVAALYVEYRPIVRNWVWQHAPYWFADEDIEDAVQTVFERACRAAPRYQPREVPPSAWLLRIARNLLIDQRGRQGSVLFAPLEDAEHVAARAGDPAVTIDLAAAVSRLTTQRRAAFVGHYIQDRPYADVARRLGIREQSAARRGRHALTDLRVLLAETG